MSQHDFNVANQGFPALRTDLNLALVALAENSSGAGAPSTTFAFQWWADTTAGVLKMRNSPNTDWVTVGTLNTTNLGLAVSTNTVNEVTVQVFTSSGTYTKPSDLLFAIVELVGGGGGGGGSGTTAQRGAGSGAGGGYAREVLAAASIGATETVTIGTAGTAGGASGAGGAGGTTSFGALLSATGGDGGSIGSTNPDTGASGGVGSGGDFNIVGGAGTPAVGINNSANGGDSYFGGGAPGLRGDVNGVAGSNYGGGGSGGSTSDTSGNAGGAGAAGIVIVTEFKS